MIDTEIQHGTQVMDDRMQRLIRESHPGQAHWGGTGPEGKTCRQCALWKDNGYYAASNPQHSNGLKPGACTKYRQMMGRPGPSFPHTAKACRFFLERGENLPASCANSQ